MLDVETYLNTFQKIRISKDLILQVGKFTVEDIAQTKAIGQKLQDKKKAADDAGETMDESEAFANIIDQMMVVLKRDNPSLKRSQLEQLPPAAINGVFKFLLKEGMGLGEGLGNATVEAAKPAITSA